MGIEWRGMRLLIIVLLIIVLVLLVTALALGREDWRLLMSSRNTISIDQQDRTYRLYNESSEEQRPLVVALHGLRDRATWLGVYSGFHFLADEQDFTLALPNGKNNSWNADFCCGRSFIDGTQDTEFILAMIDEISDIYAIDSDQVFVVGFSNGGALAQKLLHEAPTTFAGGAAVMSGVGSNSSELDISNAKDPLMLINGDNDQYVPVEKRSQGDDFSFLPAFESGEKWASQLKADEVNYVKEDLYDAYIWGDGRLLQQRIYHDQSHRWPQWRLWTFPDEVPDSTRDIWQFWQDSSVAS